MHFRVITLFPDVFPGCLGVSVLGKAIAKGIWSLDIIDLRKFAPLGSRVDGAPFGGGPGMVIRPDVLGKAVECAISDDWCNSEVFF